MNNNRKIMRTFAQKVKEVELKISRPKYVFFNYISTVSESIYQNRQYLCSLF